MDFSAYDNIHEAIYISDLETYDLLYMNKACRKSAGVSDDTCPLGKCYQVLQGLSEPCPFCNNARLVKDKNIVWERYNEKANGYFVIHDSLTEYQGRAARMELFMDVSFIASDTANVKSALAAERSIVACVEKLIASDNIKLAIHTVMETILHYYQGDRAYIFEIDWNKDISSNTYEVCKEGIQPEIDNLQDVPLEANYFWIEEFKEHRNIWIEDINNLPDDRQGEYDVLSIQGIQSLITVPFFRDGTLHGYMGVDNPRIHVDDSRFLNYLTYFISSELTKKSMQQRLEILSYTDNLTGLDNRNSYAKYIAEYLSLKNVSAGVVFMDLNGLKKINDTFGHDYGDQFLINLTELVKEHFRRDAIFRISGDEFVVICEKYTEEEFNHLVDDFRRSLQTGDTVLAACGSAWSGSLCNLEKLVKLADQEMYARKQAYYAQMAQTKNIRQRMLVNSANVPADTSLLDELPAGIAIFDCYTNKVNLVYANPEFYALSGRSMEEYNLATPVSSTEIIHPDDLYVVKNLMIQTEISGKPTLCSFRVRNADGSYHRVCMNAVRTMTDLEVSRFYTVSMKVEDHLEE